MLIGLLDFVRSIEGERFSHHKANAGTSACDDRNDAFDGEEVGCFQV